MNVFLALFLFFTPIYTPISNTPYESNVNSSELIQYFASNEFRQSLVSGVIASVVASAIFLIFLSFQKPNIKISKQIAYREENGEKYYTIKIVNKTWSPIINIQMILNHAEFSGYLDRPKKKIFWIIPLPTKDNDGIKLTALNPLKMGRKRPETPKNLQSISSFKVFKSEADEPFAIHIRIPHEVVEDEIQNIKDIVDGDNNDEFLLFEVFATHSFSGFGRSFKQKYKKTMNTNRVINGTFKGGEDMTIADNNS